MVGGIGRSRRGIAVLAVAGSLVLIAAGIAVVRHYTRSAAGAGLPKGSGWRTTPSVTCPAVLGRRDVFGVLSGIAATGPRDAWATGYCGTTGSVGRYGTYVGLIEHWTGGGWRRVPAPHAQSYTKVVAVSARDVWATAGSSHASGVYPPAAVHWNGRRWSPAAEGLPAGAAFETLVATASGVWGVADTGDPDQAFLVRREAGVWRRVAPPPGSSLAGGDYSSDSQLGVDPGGGLWLGLDSTDKVAHYQGGRWDVLRVPSTRRYGSLRAVAVTSDGTCVVTTQEYDDEEEQVGPTVVRRWDGRRWTPVPVPAGFDVGAATGDGHGGLWLRPVEYGSLVHGDGRRWTGRPQPVPDFAVAGDGEPHLARAPGTSIVWAVGADHFRTVPRSTFPFSRWGLPVIKAYRP